jgi:hypothetical protein
MITSATIIMIRMSMIVVIINQVLTRRYFWQRR